MAQDVHKGRRTEIDHMNGHIVERGRAVGIPTPVNAAVVDMILAIDNKEIAPGPANIAKTLKNAGLA
jgi:2-dehydropantoate 2-reductase